MSGEGRDKSITVDQYNNEAMIQLLTEVHDLAKVEPTMNSGGAASDPRQVRWGHTRLCSAHVEGH